METGAYAGSAILIRIDSEVVWCSESYFFAERNADGIRPNGDAVARKDGTTSFW